MEMEAQTARSCPAEIIKARIAVMKEVSGVGKSGRNDFHKYDYASDFDVLTAVRGPMVKNGLALEMWPVSVDADPDGNMRVLFMMQWQHESGAVSEPMPWYGVANDKDRNGKNGDKWFNKAATAAEKYFFLKQFHIPASKDDDPDADATLHANAKHPAQPRTVPNQQRNPAATGQATKYVDAQIKHLGTIASKEEYEGWRDAVDEKLAQLKNGYQAEYDRLVAVMNEVQAKFTQPVAAE